MPLATATSLFFASPFLMTIFAIFILKEQVKKLNEDVEKLIRNGGSQ